MDLIAQAEGFCKAAHHTQVRKYTGEHYWRHCQEVAFTVQLVGARPQAVAAAWLHDVLEDTSVKPTYLESCFGSEVLQLVLEVTDVSMQMKGNRTIRKEADRIHLSKSSPLGATIKLADLIDNSKSITKHDPDFARVYLAEKEKLLEVLRHGNQELWAKAKKILIQSQEQLVQHYLGQKA